MSLIVSEVYDELLEAGASEEKAKAAAIPLAERLVTKEDLAELKASLDARLSKLDRDVAMLKFGYGPAILALLVKIAFFLCRQVPPGATYR